MPAIRFKPLLVVVDVLSPTVAAAASLFRKSLKAIFLLLRIFNISLEPFSVIIVFDKVSLVSLFTQLVIIFECNSFVDVVDEDIIVVDDDDKELEVFLLLLILDMADDEDDVSNERGNTWGFKGKSKFFYDDFCLKCN